VPDRWLGNFRWRPNVVEFSHLESALKVTEEMKTIRTSLRDVWPPSTEKVA
jgi:hypothetical protein